MLVDYFGPAVLLAFHTHCCQKLRYFLPQYFLPKEANLLSVSTLSTSHHVGVPDGLHLVQPRHLVEDDVIEARVEVIERPHDKLGGQLVSPPRSE